ncbi:MAG: hypothetical protein KatS3mg108_2728 [Isosphaeraceae bacterium]|nr:MAG: hypothetical protein KatS3mg108_2728 [Isosphaeraceae bacterium]
MNAAKSSGPRADWRAILDALIRADHTWQTPGALARWMGRDIEQLTDTLAEMDLAGWLAVWERPDGVRVTLSAWAARQLRVRLVEAGGVGRWRWLPARPQTGGRSSGRLFEPRRGGSPTAPSGRSTLARIGPDRLVGALSVGRADQRPPAGTTRALEPASG